MLKVVKNTMINGESIYRLTCNKKIEKQVKIQSVLVEHGTEELFYYSTNIEGVYSFGCKQLTDGAFHKAGYTWSSRPGCINGQFGTQLTEVVIDGAGCWAIDISTLKPLVEEYTGKTYNIKKYYSFYDKEKEEPCYRLVEV